MAKAGIILRGARGKIGDIVAQKGSRGGTIIRERVTPKTSKSRRATAQKVIFTTVTQAAAAMASLIDHSFQGRSAEMSRQEFIRTNLNTMRALAANDFASEATPQTASVSAIQFPQADYISVYTLFPSFTSPSKTLMGGVPRNLATNRLIGSS